MTEYWITCFISTWFWYKFCITNCVYLQCTLWWVLTVCVPMELQSQSICRTLLSSTKDPHYTLQSALSPSSAPGKPWALFCHHVLVFIFKVFVYKWNRTVSICLDLTFSTLHHNFKVHLCWSLYWYLVTLLLTSIKLYKYIKVISFIHLLLDTWFISILAGNNFKEWK